MLKIATAGMEAGELSEALVDIDEEAAGGAGVLTLELCDDAELEMIVGSFPLLVLALELLVLEPVLTLEVLVLELLLTLELLTLELLLTTLELLLTLGLLLALELLVLLTM